MMTLFKTITSFYLDDDYVDRKELELIAYFEYLRNEDNVRYWVSLRHVDLRAVVTAELVCLFERFPEQILKNLEEVAGYFTSV